MAIGSIPTIVCAVFASGAFAAPSEPIHETTPPSTECSGDRCSELLYPPFKEVRVELCNTKMRNAEDCRCVALGLSVKWVRCESKLTNSVKPTPSLNDTDNDHYNS